MCKINIGDQVRYSDAVLESDRHYYRRWLKGGKRKRAMAEAEIEKRQAIRGVVIRLNSTLIRVRLTTGESRLDLLTDWTLAE